MFKFAEHDVVIPMIVLSELDRLKKRDGAVGVSARRVARELDDLRDATGKLHDGVPLGDNKGTLTVLDHGSIKPSFCVEDEASYADNIILEICLKHPEYVLVTEDTLMRVKADTLDINVERYKNATIDNNELYQDYKVVPLDYGNHVKFFDKKDVDINDAAPDLELSVNEYVKIQGGGLGRAKKGGTLSRLSESMEFMGIKTKNAEQAFLADALFDPTIEVVCVVGKAGCGKTLVTLAAGLDQAGNRGASSVYKSVTVARPAISMGKELGFLPGDLAEKLDPWMGPIKDAIEVMHPVAKRDVFTEYVNLGVLKVESLSHIRGRSLPNTFLIIDEAQNLTPHEVKTILTRVGHGTKIVLTGDPYQIDNPYLDELNNGLVHAISAFKGHECFAHVVMRKGERSKVAELAANIM